MKISPNNISKFLAQDYKNYRATLFYGSDTGLVFDRCESIVKKHIKTSEESALNKVRLQYKDILSDNSLLAEEISSLSFIGGPKVIIIDNVEGQIPKSIQEFVVSNSDNIVLFKARDLLPNSGIRKFFEANKNVAILPCYTDDKQSVRNIITKFFVEHNLKLVDPEILDDIAMRIKGDRQAILSELQKIALYYSDDKNSIKNVSTDVIYQIISSDFLSLEYDTLLGYIVSGKQKKMNSVLHKMFDNGENIIAILRNLSSFFIKLLKAKTLVEKGSLSPKDALSSIKPPIFFKQIPIYNSSIQKYSVDQMLRIIKKFTTLEIQCKKLAISKEVFTKILCDIF